MTDEPEKTFDDHDKLVRILTLMEGNQKNFDRLEQEVREIRRETKESYSSLERRVDKLESKLDTQQGGIGVARWMWGAVGGLPFLGGLIGYVLSQRGA